MTAEKLRQMYSGEELLEKLVETDLFSTDTVSPESPDSFPER